MNKSLVQRSVTGLVWCVLGLLLVWLISWALVPRWVQWQVEKQGTQALGRVVKIHEVSFQPWSMTLTLRDLRMATRGAGSDHRPSQVSIEEVVINASWQSLLMWAPVADALVVRNPKVHLSHRGQGRFDVDDVLALLASAGGARTGMPRMSLFNIQVVGGSLSLLDAPLSITHSLTDVQLDIPFLSNLGGRREVATHPRLAFKLNGSSFDSDAHTTPFAADRQTHARFHIQGLDVRPYVHYWPAAWPVRLTKGRLDLDWTLDFRQLEVPEITVSGHMAVQDMQLDERINGADFPLLSWSSLNLTLASWRPLEGLFNVAALHVDQPVFHLRRDPSGVLNAVRLPSFFSTAISAPRQAAPFTASFVVQGVDISGGQLNWHDAAMDSPVSWSVTDLAFKVGAWTWPLRQSTSLEGTGRWAGSTVSWRGTTDGERAQMRLHVPDVALKTVAPYASPFLRPELSGQLAAELNLDWRAATPSQQPRWVVRSPQIRVSAVSMGARDGVDLSWSDLLLDQVEVDVLQQTARVGGVAWTRPVLSMARSAKGRWMFEDGLMADSNAPPVQPSLRAWQLHLGPVQIHDGALKLDDRGLARRVSWQVRDLNLRTGPWQPWAASSPPTPIQLNFNTGTVQSVPAQVGFEGVVRWPVPRALQAQEQPLQIKGQLHLNRFPLHRLKAYAAERLNVDLRRADLSYAGAVDWLGPTQGWGLDLKGQLALENVQALNPADGEAVLDIQTLNLTGLDVTVREGDIQKLKIADTSVRDFSVRVAVDEQGHLNLQHLLKAEPGAQAPSHPAPVVIDWGPVEVVNGHVVFSDRYIQPPYAADITDLNGRLGALSSASGEAMADISLRGRVDDSGSLDVTGRMNPFTRPVGLDVRGRVSDLELPQLSPYSNKYAGYGIERGKLSAEVHYRIGGEGQLTAKQQIRLQQLRFGARSDRSDAPTIPVKLAVALLADRDGVIDLDLPLSGSINDPEFQVGPLVWRMVLNLIGKAALSPFSWISGRFASDEALQHIEFLPAQTDVNWVAIQKLEAVAKGLLQKPMLRLTVVGQADLQTERAAWRKAKLHDRVMAEKRRRQLRDPRSDRADAEVRQDEYPALLKAVYRRSPLSTPSNVLGALKGLTVADMEAELMAAIEVDEADMRDLAQARAQHVRAALLALNVPSAQVYLGATVVNPAGQAQPLAPKALLVVSTE